MANQQHLDILRQGVEIWNQWRKENPSIAVDLREANLVGANLAEADLKWVNLKGADLSKANLSDANLTGARLTSANLATVSLTGAILHMTNLSNADLQNASLFRASLNGAILFRANLSGADLMNASLVKTDLRKANVSDCRIYGISVWEVQLQGAIQHNLVITNYNDPTITVDNLEIAQFIYLLLNHKKLRDILNSVMERGVLILGRFGDGGLELLQAVAEKLREMKYLPIIFDFDRPDGRNFTETVMTLVGLSRFVIVDLSGPSVPNELRAAVPHFRVPFVPIIEQDRKVYSMFDDLLENDWVLSPVEFTSKEHLLELLPSMVIEPAEKKCEERQIRLKQIFNR
jgi:uncharacterized protein YjbI with pentapeptide repeats